MSASFPTQPWPEHITKGLIPSPYSPLNYNEDEIRLVTFLPQTSETDLVRCNLETVSLKSLVPEYKDFVSLSNPTKEHRRKVVADWFHAQYRVISDTQPRSRTVENRIPIRASYRFMWGDYAALSYVWGESHSYARKPILVNGREIFVGKNLEVALRVLCASPEFVDGYKLWIDALCINQEDLEERGHQIAKMRDIYSNAWTVIAWLGEERSDSGKAIDLVRALSEASAKQNGQELEARLLENPAYLGSGSWLALHELMQRPYWFRLWIIQELVLGSSAVILRCGDHFIDWTSFCVGIGFLFDYLWTIKDQLLKKDIYSRDLEPNTPTAWGTTSLHLIHQDLWPLSLYEEQGENRFSFGRLLILATSADVLDVRDKVYGLVGLMDASIADQLVPDYICTPSKTFTTVAKAFIRTYLTLDPIREGNPWSDLNAPSWAADWTWNGRLRHARLEESTFWTRNNLTSGSKSVVAYQASGNTWAEPSFSEDDLHLTCRGILVDKIASLTARELGFFSWSRESIAQPNKGNMIYGDTTQTAKALYHALIADRDPNGQKANDRHEAILSLPSTFLKAERQFKQLGWSWFSTQEGYYYRWQGWRLANMNFGIGDRRLDDFFTDNIPFGAVERDYKDVYSCFDRASKGRRFMTTEAGYMGWAPDNMYGNDEDQTRIGDLIAIVFGCSTPIVIRPYGEHFQVVGDAYIQGLMDGEAIEFLESGRYMVQDFTLL